RRARRQILLRKAGIAVTNTDAQIHIVLSRRIAHQTDQKVAGDLPLLALDLQIGRGKRDGLIVERPTQATASTIVVPGPREQLSQMQTEIPVIEAQLAAGEIALYRTAD